MNKTLLLSLVLCSSSALGYYNYIDEIEEMGKGIVNKYTGNSYTVRILAIQLM